MLRDEEVEDFHFTSASQAHRAGGLLGWVRFRAGGFRFDGIAVRRTRDGRFALSWPARKDGEGRLHYSVCPADDATRREAERQVLHLLGEVLEA